jgi:hypothetical protein
MSANLDRRLQKLERQIGANGSDGPVRYFAVTADGTVYLQVCESEGPTWQTWRKPPPPYSLRRLMPILPGETIADWNAYLAGMIEALDPVGTLEIELAGRVAELSWRLRRVAVYETAHVAEGIDEATSRARCVYNGSPSIEPRTPETVRLLLEAARENVADCLRDRDAYRRLAELSNDHRFTGEEADDLLGNVSLDPNDPDLLSHFDTEDPAFLADVGLPPEARDDPWSWDGWTAELVRKGIEMMAKEFGLTAAARIEITIRHNEEFGVGESERAKDLETELAEIEGKLAREERTRAQRVLPTHPTMEKVIPYENHLTRQLAQTLGLLERHQSTRAGKVPPLPGND